VVQAVTLLGYGLSESFGITAEIASGTNMNVPTFLVIGAPKAGTTSLHYYLAGHPEVFVSRKVKEVRFFAFDPENPSHVAKSGREFPVTTWEEYLALFADASGFKAIGESSPQYLGSPLAAKQIAARLPEVKVIAVLRNPVDRTVSAFLQDVRNKNADLSDLNEHTLSESRWAKGSLYHEDLQRYYKLLPKEQIKVFRFCDLVNTPERVVKSVYEFVGVKPDFLPDTTVRHNKGGVPNNKTLDTILRRLRKPGVKKVLKPYLPSSVRKKYTSILEGNLVNKEVFSTKQKRRVIDDFREDILMTEELVGLDLSGWLEGAP